MQKLRVLELFAGLGACSKALERLNIPHEIVDAVEIDKYAIKSFNAIHGTNFEPQDITKWDKDVDVDLIMHGSPCFTGETLILTQDGYKTIIDINVGDSVLTHKNRYNVVAKKVNQGEKNIYCVKAMSCDELKTTENHKFYVRPMTRKWDNPNRTYTRIFDEPKWKECKDITKSDYLGIAINNKSILPKWEGVVCSKNNKEYIIKQLDMNNPILWYICGRYVGDGWLRTRQDRNNSLSIVQICCGKHKLNEFLNKLDDSFHYTLSEERTTYRLTFSNIELAHFLNQFGRGALNKRIPGFMFSMPIEHLQHFLDGYFDSDGSYSNGLYKVTSVSRELIYGVARLIEKVYHRPCSIYKAKRPKTCVIEGRVVNQNDTYSLCFKKHASKQDHSFYENGYIWIPIRSIENTNTKEVVYDIEVQDDHSFTANGLIVHNCQDFSLAGKQAGGDEGSGTRSSLMYETIRIVEKLKPKYVVWENVKNLLSKKHKHNFDAYLETMERLGYKNYYQVLNAKDYGAPQNRERVFTVSVRNDINIDFSFPQKQPLKLKLKDLLEDKVDEKYYLSDEQVNRIRQSTYTQNQRRIQEKEYCDTLCARDWKDPKCVEVVRKYGIFDTEKSTHQAGSVYDENGLSPTLDTMQGGYRQPCVEVKDSIYSDESVKRIKSNIIKGNVANTLTANAMQSFNHNNCALIEEGYVEKKYREFIDEEGYIPEMYNPYNNSEIKDIAPTQSTYCGSTTSSATVLIKNKRLQETLETNTINRDVSYIDAYNRNIRNDDLSGTITARYNDNNKFIAIKNATKQGYLEATDGDGINISSRMKYQRGNVQKECIQTLTTSGGNDRGVVVYDQR